MAENASSSSSVQLSLLGDSELKAVDPAPPTHKASKTSQKGDGVEARSWAHLREQAHKCNSCEWACQATQTVFGRGPIDAAVMLVGEQPGDQEDLAGAPFVGPAGQLLRSILAQVPLDPQSCYLTNAVKHFKWTPQGKRRLHQRPSAKDIAACRPWLVAEQHWVRPRLVIVLGLVAAHSLIGKAVRLGEVRGRRTPLVAHDNTWITSHPSAILRMPDPGEQQAARELMVAELQQALATIA